MDREAGQRATARSREPNRPLNSLAEGWRARAREKRDNRARGRRSSARTHDTRARARARAGAQSAWRLQRHFSRSLRSAGVDLMNGNVGIIVFTRGTHGCLSRHTWRGNIPFIKRAARSSHRRHTYTRGHPAAGEGYATLFRLPGVDTSDVFRISPPPEGWRFSSARNNPHPVPASPQDNFSRDGTKRERASSSRVKRGYFRFTVVNFPPFRPPARLFLLADRTLSDQNYFLGARRGKA